MGNPRGPHSQPKASLLAPIPNSQGRGAGWLTLPSLLGRGLPRSPLEGAKPLACSAAAARGVNTPTTDSHCQCDGPQSGRPRNAVV